MYRIIMNDLMEWYEKAQDKVKRMLRSDVQNAELSA